MKPSTFFSKLTSRYLWGNLLAMGVVVVALVAAVKVGLDYYTHHGEEVTVPDLKGKALNDGRHLLHSLGLSIEVGDTGYVKLMPAGCILEQSIEAGRTVKAGRTVRVVLNSTTTPTLTIPDIIDNCSWREARARLTAMGFRVGEPQYITGEHDWVYGITVRGHSVVAGQKVSIDDVLTVQVGSGTRDDNDSVMYIDAMVDDDYYDADDDFEEVTGGDDAYRLH